MGENFKALQVIENESGEFNRRVIQRDISDLPDNDVLIRVKYSGLNYKDALSASGHKGVTRNYPHTPGIDAAGIIESSTDSRFQKGDQVLVSSYDLGMNTDGGFGTYISVPGDWVIPLPDKMTLRESMIFGTAGLTAAQGLHSMIHNGQKPDMGKLLVTGARGAVGGFAIMIAAKLGFDVVAGVSQMHDDTEKLLNLGACEVVDSSLTNDKSSRPLLRPAWAGAFDVIGGNTLATILKSVSYGGNVVTVGNIESHELKTTVFPFILNGINLLGVGTQDTPMSLRTQLWNLLADDWKPDNMNDILTEIGFDELDQYLSIMITKKSGGRILLNLDS